MGQFVCYEHKPLGRSLHTHPSAHVYSRSQSHLLFLLLPSASYHHTLPHEAQFQHHCHALKKVLLNTYLPTSSWISSWNCCISRGKMWIHAGWYQVLHICFFTESHSGSLGGGKSSDVRSEQLCLLCSQTGTMSQAESFSCNSRMGGCLPQWEDFRSQCPQYLPWSHSTQVTDHHFAFQDIWFSTSYCSLFHVPDLNSRNCNWHQLSPTCDLHFSSAKHRYSIAPTEAQTSKKWEPLFAFSRLLPYFPLSLIHGNGLHQSASLEKLSWSLSQELCWPKPICQQIAPSQLSARAALESFFTTILVYKFDKKHEF